MIDQSLGNGWQVLGRHVLMNQELFGRVADGRPLDLGVDGDVGSHLEVGILVNVDVAIAGPGLDYRDGGRLDNPLDEALATSGDEDVDVVREVHHLLGELMTGVPD